MQASSDMSTQAAQKCFHFTLTAQNTDFDVEITTELKNNLHAYTVYIQRHVLPRESSSPSECLLGLKQKLEFGACVVLVLTQVWYVTADWSCYVMFSLVLQC